MDFYVVLDRAGYRVAKRRKCVQHVGTPHKITKEDAIKWCAPAGVPGLPVATGVPRLPALLSRGAPARLAPLTPPGVQVPDQVRRCGQPQDLQLLSALEAAVPQHPASLYTA